jgi:calcineurin-binding protein cabin-1
MSQTSKLYINFNLFQIASQEDIDAIFKMCIKNLEECVTRFPEHYKSVYRLVYHFMNAVGETKSLEKSKQLLTGTYKTALGNFVQGLFSERKNNNFFNVRSISILNLSNF